MVWVSCSSKKHDGSYGWDYSGGKSRGEYVTCPVCGYKVRIPEKEP